MLQSKSVFLLFYLIITLVQSFTQKIVVPNPTKKVIVTGAAGRTGNLVFSSLLRNEKFNVVGLVRTEKSAKKLLKQTKCGLEKVWVCDITQMEPDGENGLPNGVAGAEAMIICTSSVPKLSKRSLTRAFLKIPLNIVRKKKLINFRELQYKYAPGQYPEKVDYEGQIAQIKLAKKLGISHIILLGSMGGTNPDDFLNSIGKDKDGKGNGDILIYKRKSEKYLVDSGIHYTIIHPGGLRDTPCGELDLKLDVNDNLMNEKKRAISRCDVASLCIASLSEFNGVNASFDCINCEVKRGSFPQTPEMAIQDFLQKGKVYDYSV